MTGVETHLARMIIQRVRIFAEYEPNDSIRGAYLAFLKSLDHACRSIAFCASACYNENRANQQRRDAA